ncbi:MAG: GNAT family N-acetyltransferase [Ruminococcus sp.]|uniref:GNAT family N-acetyltransferase n=1 Tax=Ruminococcus sp. TaxID=41978 RepID=UPI001B257287|nr:GNAT family N-acetyltransferase [Ruminococcus sp.]MBO7472581.1 GNAT family N-acetyltransferase [Ruminococcus sp.]
MIRLEKVNGRNVWDIIGLSVDESQRKFVADNKTSIIEAYAAMTGGGQVFPFGIYDGDTPVGFVMIGFGTDEYWEDPPQIAYNNYNIWRFMIDRHFQNKGYGKAALKLALDFIHTYPCGNAEKCWLSYEEENIVAQNLYRSFGFEPNGEKDGEETIAIIAL